MRDAMRRRLYARHRRRPAIHVLTPLAIGGLIYVLWRSDSLLMFRWFEALGVAKLVAQLRVFAKALQLREGQAVTFVGVLDDWGTIMPITLKYGQIVR